MTAEDAVRADGPRDEPAFEVRLARAYLLRVAEPPSPALAELVDACGPVEAARRVWDGRVPPAVANETDARRRHTVSAADLEQARTELGARLIIPEDDEWPAWPLLAMTVAAGRGVKGMTPPLALWARGSGRLADAAERAVTMVGSRAASGYGEFVAADWAYALAGRQVAVFSGAAYGIDAASHRGALAAEWTTVAVLGCALDAGYPAGHDLLLRKIAERGLVLSEYPLGTPPARHRFLVRNRLLAALSAGTVVVEADVRSGARNTANTAGLLGKPVMAVPGPLTSRSSAGCHDMIRAQKATLVTSPAEVLELVGQLGVDLAAPKAPSARATDELSGDALKVHEALQPDAGRSVERLAVESGVPERKVRSLLPLLELDGFSQRCESGWRRARAARAAGGVSCAD
jgi:DNA processing protein